MVIVETETAMYMLDVVKFLLKRYPRDEPVEVEKYKDLPPAAVEQLRKDGEYIPFNFLAPLEVGKPAQFLLTIRDDGVQTVRTTTNVLKVSFI